MDDFTRPEQRTKLPRISRKCTRVKPGNTSRSQSDIRAAYPALGEHNARAPACSTSIFSWNVSIDSWIPAPAGRRCPQHSVVWYRELGIRHTAFLACCPSSCVMIRYCIMDLVFHVLRLRSQADREGLFRSEGIFLLYHTYTSVLYL